MTDNGHTIKINVDVDIENDIEMDSHGVLNVVTLVYEDVDDDPIEVRTPFTEIITGVLEYYSDDLTREGYGEMYRLGHALRGASERVLEVAERHEDLVNGEGTYPDSYLDEGDVDAL